MLSIWRILSSQIITPHSLEFWSNWEIRQRRLTGGDDSGSWLENMGLYLQPKGPNDKCLCLRRLNYVRSTGITALHWSTRAGREWLFKDCRNANFKQINFTQSRDMHHCHSPIILPILPRLTSNAGLLCWWEFLQMEKWVKTKEDFSQLWTVNQRSSAHTKSILQFWLLVAFHLICTWICTICFDNQE